MSDKIKTIELNTSKIKMTPPQVANISSENNNITTINYKSNNNTNNQVEEYDFEQNQTSNIKKKYDEDGNITEIEYTTNNLVTKKEYYTATENGGTRLCKIINYTYSAYDGMIDTRTLKEYDKNGQLSMEEYIEYDFAPPEPGEERIWTREIKNYENGQISTYEVQCYDIFGESYELESDVIKNYKNGLLMKEENFDSFGILKSRTEYKDGNEDLPIKQEYYLNIIGNNSELYKKIDCKYNEDGKIANCEVSTYDLYNKTIKYNSKYEYDENENIIFGSCNGENIDIFGDYNLETEQYGGSQSAVSDLLNMINLLRDDIVLKTLNEYYPNASQEDFEFYLNKITNVGCGYTAEINTLFKEYEGREEEFLKVFGFPMYNLTNDGEIDFNYEYLIIDYFNYVWGNKGYSIEELYGNIGQETQDAAISDQEDKGKATGTSKEIYKEFDDYLKEKYNINAEVNVVEENDFKYMYIFNSNFISSVRQAILDATKKTKYVDYYKENFNENEKVIINSRGYNLYTIDELTGKKDKLCSANGGAHAMYITGINEEGDFVVSSWGKQYILDLSNIVKNNGYLSFTKVDY